MPNQRRTPGTTRIEDRWYNQHKQPTTRHGQGSRWLLRWVDNNGKEKTKSYARKTDAKRHQEAISAQFHKGTYINPESARIRLHALYSDWENTLATLSPSSITTRKNTYKNHVKPHWGNHEIGSITKADITNWVAELKRNGIGTPTIKNAVVVLRQILGYAVDHNYLHANPAQQIKTPKNTTSRHIYLTVAQVEQLANNITYLPDAIRVLAYTGLRWGELAALEVADVDTTARTLYISKSTSETAGKAYSGSTKTGHARIVHYPQVLHNALLEAVKDKAQQDLVFTSIYGSTLRGGNYRKRIFVPAVEACQQQASEINAPEFPTLTPHDLRHTAASLAISSGANVKAVQRMLGHASAAMTLDTYADLFPNDLEAVAVSMDAKIRAEMNSSEPIAD